MSGDWTSGYSQADLDRAQEQFGLRFPPDLEALLRDRRPVRGFDWRTDIAAIKRALTWPLEGLLFDVEENALWFDIWGERPSRASERAELVAEVVAGAPRLIPILGHRYLPETPRESGNPVFSVYQSDIIVYGANLADYFANEFGTKPFTTPSEARHIPFWSDFVES